MKPIIVRSKDRVGKKATKLKEDEDTNDRRLTGVALSKVDLRPYLLEGSKSDKKGFESIIQTLIAELKPSSLDECKETRDLWENCIERLNPKYSSCPTREKPQDFKNNNNNVNKFFGNSFGNLLRSYVNSLGVYFAGRHTFQSREDYSLFVEWVLLLTTSQLDELVVVEEDRKVHTSRIVLHFIKLFSMHFHGNEVALFGDIGYSKHWSIPTVRGGNSKKRKGGEKDEDEVDTNGDEGCTNSGKITNTIFHNVVQNVKRHLLDTNQAIGIHLIEQSTRVTSNLHVSSNKNIEVHDEFRLITDQPLSFHELCIEQFQGDRNYDTAYAPFCEFGDASIYEKKGEDEADKPDVKEDFFGNIMDKLPSDALLARNNPLSKPTFLGFDVVDLDTEVLTLRTPGIEVHPDWGYIAQGGGPFCDMLSNGLRVAMVIGVPIYFICTTLVNGPSEMNQVRGVFPYEKMSEKEFDKMRYQDIDLTKEKQPQRATFLSDGKSHVDSDSFNQLLLTFIVHLLNNVVYDKVEIHADFRVPTEAIEYSRLRDLSFGDFLNQTVDSLYYIFDHKVRYLSKLKTRTNDVPMICWIERLKSLLEIAYKDVLACLQCYADLIRSSVMTYVLLSNKTKEGYDITDLFRSDDGILKSTKVFVADMPFHQMGRLIQIGIMAFYLNLPALELLKSLNTKKCVDRIPEIDDIASTLKHSFQAMLSSEPFGKLVASSDLKNLRHKDYSLNYLLWIAMMKDLELSCRPHFFFPPYDATQINDEKGDADTSDKKKTKNETEHGTLQTFSLSSLMGKTTTDRKRIDSADPVSIANSTTPNSNKGGSKTNNNSNALRSSNRQVGNKDISSNLGATTNSQKLPVGSATSKLSNAINSSVEKKTMSTGRGTDKSDGNKTPISKQEGGDKSNDRVTEKEHGDKSRKERSNEVELGIDNRIYWCACGCEEESDLWDDLCIHCNNQMIERHESEEVTGCCNICAEGVQIMTGLFEEINTREELASTFHKNEGILKKMPDETFIQYETITRTVSSSSRESGIKKTISHDMISIPALYEFFHNWGNSHMNYKEQTKRKIERTDFLVAMVKGHEEYKVILDETQEEFKLGEWQLELVNPVLYAFFKIGTIFRNPMAKTLVEVLYKIYKELKDQ